MNRRPTVLLVDDDQFFRVPLALALKQAGFKTLEARTARDATLQLAERKPDLVVVDYRMPGTDGIAWVQQMRESDVKLPMVLLSGSGMDQKNIAKLRGVLGVDLILRKPINTERFIEQISELLNTQAETDHNQAPVNVDAQGTECQQGTQVQGEVADLCDDSPSSNFDEVASAMASLQSAYAENLRCEIERIDTLIADWKRACQSDSLREVSGIVHKIRGSAGSYGLDTAGEVAGQIENLLNAQQDNPRADDELRDLFSYQFVKLKTAAFFTERPLLEDRSRLKPCISFETQKDYFDASDMPVPLEERNGGDSELVVEGCFDDQVEDCLTHASVQKPAEVFAQTQHELFSLLAPESRTLVQASFVSRENLRILALGTGEAANNSVDEQIIVTRTNSLNRAIQSLNRQEVDLFLIDSKLRNLVELDPVIAAARERGVHVPFAFVGDQAANMCRPERIFRGDCFAGTADENQGIGKINRTAIERIKALAIGYETVDRRAFLNWLNNFEPDASEFSIVVFQVEPMEEGSFLNGVSVQDELLANVESILSSRLRFQDVRCRWSDRTFVIGLPGIDANMAEEVVELFRTDNYNTPSLTARKYTQTPNLRLGCAQSGPIIIVDRLLEDAFKSMEKPRGRLLQAVG